VSRTAGAPHAERLLPLPAFLLSGQSEGDWPDIVDGFRLTGHFLRRDILNDRRIDPWAARERLIDRILRLMG
jgi:DNA repair protein RecO (recombination protein O)